MNFTPVIPSLTITGNQCVGTGVTFNASNGENYEWTGAFNGQTGNTKTSSAVTGNYTTSVRNYVSANGITCYSAYTAEVTGSVNEKPSKPTLTASKNPKCPGEAVTISLPNWYGLPGGVEGRNYHISGIVWGQSANVGTGSYKGQVQHPNGCWSDFSDPLTISDVTAPGITSQPQAQTVCQGANATLSVGADAGYGSINSIEWWRDGVHAGSGSQIATGTAGNYTARITTSHGCAVNSNTVAVTVNACGPTTTCGTVWSGATFKWKGVNYGYQADWSTGCDVAAPDDYLATLSDCHNPCGTGCSIRSTSQGYVYQWSGSPTCSGGGKHIYVTRLQSPGNLTGCALVAYEWSGATLTFNGVQYGYEKTSGTPSIPRECWAPVPGGFDCSSVIFSGRTSDDGYQCGGCMNCPCCCGIQCQNFQGVSGSVYFIKLD